MEQQTDDGIQRRSFLKRAAVTGAVTVWATPTVQSLVSPAFATGTGTCPPGRLIRFKYDVDSNGFDSGATNGGGASWCLPDGYADASYAVNGAGNTVTFTLSGKQYTLSVTISADGKSAVVTLPDGAVVEDLQAKAGSVNNGECLDFDPATGSTAEVTLLRKEISFVAGVICLPY